MTMPTKRLMRDLHGVSKARPLVEKNRMTTPTKHSLRSCFAGGPG